jgi:hypothetical protein
VSCDKIQYETYEAAKGDLEGLRQRKRRQKFTAYKCNLCGLFHITTITKGNLRTPKRIDKYPIKADEILVEHKEPEHKKKKKKKK